MKNLNLNTYGVQEMNEGEMRATEGGWILVAVIVVCAVVIFAAGVYAGYKEAQASAK
jgi:lactobin A/cerein 7B family class IIb bacteriocin